MTDVEGLEAVREERKGMRSMGHERMGRSVSGGEHYRVAKIATEMGDEHAGCGRDCIQSAREAEKGLGNDKEGAASSCRAAAPRTSCCLLRLLARLLCVSLGRPHRRCRAREVNAVPFLQFVFFFNAVLSSNDRADEGIEQLSDACTVL